MHRSLKQTSKVVVGKGSDWAASWQQKTLHSPAVGAVAHAWLADGQRASTCCSHPSLISSHLADSPLAAPCCATQQQRLTASQLPHFPTSQATSHSQVEAVLVGDEVDGEAQVAKAPRAAHAMQVGLAVLGEVEVDDHVDGLQRVGEDREKREGRR